MAGCMYVCSASTSRRVLPCNFSPGQDTGQAVRASCLLKSQHLVWTLNHHRTIGHEERAALLMASRYARKVLTD